MDNVHRLKRDMDRISAAERAAILSALRQSTRIRRAATRGRMMDCLREIARASARTAGRRASDRRTDRDRRVLVGARVPREMAERCRAAARERGISLYRFVIMALERALAAPPG